MATPSLTQYLVEPIVGTDLVVLYRGSDISRPLYLSYTKLVKALSAAISPTAGLLLKTNGTANPIQTILNLVAGSGMTITDDGAGNITFTSSGGTSFITSVSDTSDIDLNVILGDLRASLTTTGVTAGTYGDSTHVPQIVVDSKGRITSVTSVAISAGGTGTVTSVSATVPSPTSPAISVAVTNPTTTPAIAVTANGNVSQYVRGDLSLAPFPSITGGGASLSYYLNGSVSQGTFGGVAFKQMSRTPVIGSGTDFNISADGYIQSFITDANVPNQLLIPAGNWNFETYFSASSSGGSPSFYIELYKWDGAALTLIASNSTNPEDITGGTSVDLYTSAVAVPQTTLASTDRLAIRIYVTHSGRTITLHTEDNHLCQVITTFSTGITALNGLTDQVQSFATGTSGTDFGISSSGSTHTFNLPTASATNRGALSSADWTTFNNKQDAITLTTTGSSGAATLIGSTLNIPQYAGGNSIQALTGDVTASASAPSQSVAATLKTNLRVGSFGVVFDGAGGVISSSSTAYVQVPYSGTITSWTIGAAQSGSCTITAFKDTYANFPPTTPTDNIFTTAPSLSSQQKNTNPSPTFNGSMATVTAGDWIGFTITGVTTITWVNLTIQISKT